MCSMKNEGGNPDRRQDMPDIDVRVCFTESEGSPRTGAQAKEASPPLSKALVVGNAGRQRRKIDHTAPLLLYPVVPLLSFFGPGRPGIFRVPYSICEYPICDQS